MVTHVLTILVGRSSWEQTNIPGPECSDAGICDLCIEVLSDSAPGEIERDTPIKKVEYEFAGVQEYYILDASGEHIHFFANGPWPVPAPKSSQNRQASSVQRHCLVFNFVCATCTTNPDWKRWRWMRSIKPMRAKSYQASIRRAEALATELAQARAELARLRGTAG